MWASHVPCGLLASFSSVFLLPRHLLAVLTIFVHWAVKHVGALAASSPNPPPARIVQRNGVRFSS